MSVLLKIHYKTRYSTFSQIKNEDYAPAIQEGIALAKPKLMLLLIIQKHQHLRIRL
jgi:hypothetical protein